MIKQSFRSISFLLAVFLSLAACTSNAPEPTATPNLPSTNDLGAVPTLYAKQGDYFAGAGACASCHTNLTDSKGRDVSYDTLWRSTMMANAGHDPYTLAGIRREILTFPEYTSVIEDKCSTCHMPMARTTINLASEGKEQAEVLGEEGIRSPNHSLHNLAEDGVSCTVCHQINADNLGTHEGFSGHYTIASDHRIAYGPFEPIASQVEIMQTVSGFEQQQSAHIQTAELCATCHELYTSPLDATTGELLTDIQFPEQTPYTEWKYSRYSDSGYSEYQTCQGCHMPEVEGVVRVSSIGNPVPEPRSNASQHIFVGENAYMMRIFQKFGQGLGATAIAGQFQKTIDLTRQQLQNDTATLNLDNLRLADGVLSLDVVIESQVGHKLPTSYPSRRAWLHITVRDANQNIVFESGAYNSDGSIVGNANDEDPMQYEPHYDVITQPGQVQIYEPIMGDTVGHPTTVLLSAVAYLKDNRLLPLGFDKTSVPAEVAVQGDAEHDPNFVGGGDRVTYEIPLGNAIGPFTVEVELMHQTIGFRWVENLRQLAAQGPEKAPEIVQFLEYHDAVPNLPELIANASTTVK